MSEVKLFSFGKLSLNLDLQTTLQELRINEIHTKTPNIMSFNNKNEFFERFFLYSNDVITNILLFFSKMSNHSVKTFSSNFFNLNYQTFLKPETENLINQICLFNKFSVVFPTICDENLETNINIRIKVNSKEYNTNLSNRNVVKNEKNKPFFVTQNNESNAIKDFSATLNINFVEYSYFIFDFNELENLNISIDEMNYFISNLKKSASWIRIIAILPNFENSTKINITDSYKILFESILGHINIIIAYKSALQNYLASNNDDPNIIENLISRINYTDQKFLIFDKMKSFLFCEKINTEIRKEEFLIDLKSSKLDKNYPILKGAFLGTFLNSYFSHRDPQKAFLHSVEIYKRVCKYFNNKNENDYDKDFFNLKKWKSLLNQDKIFRNIKDKEENFDLDALGRFKDSFNKYKDCNLYINTELEKRLRIDHPQKNKLKLFENMDCMLSPYSSQNVLLIENKTLKRLITKGHTIKKNPKRRSQSMENMDTYLYSENKNAQTLI
jgi:hypothetical protein